MSKELDNFIEETDEPSLMLSEDEKEETVEDTSPQYRMIAEERIPISKSHGKIWKSRLDAGVARLKQSDEVVRWDEAIRYYRNDHGGRKTDTGGDVEQAVRATTRGLETENIVFANVSAIVPTIYAKNPTAEITSEDPTRQPWCDAAERLVNVLAAKRTSPGLNLKPTVRRCIVMGTLTNYAIAEVGYTHKELSNENTLREIAALGEKLKNAKEPAEIREAEGELQAAEFKLDFLEPPGPYVKPRRPHDVIVDPDASTFYEARWMMVCEYVSTEMIKAIYGRKNEKDEWESIYKPTHLLRSANKDLGLEDDTLSFTSLLEGDKNYKDYGFGDEVSYNKAMRTKVWYVWDKSTRRVYMYADNDWSWPLWVWEDPLRLPNFFPFHVMEFYTDPSELYARGETTYYLDQQDGINQINNEVAKARAFITGKVVYNKNIIKDERVVEEFLHGTRNKRILGIDVPPDTDIKKIFDVLTPPSASALQTIIFDKQRLVEAVDRVSSVTNVMRGVEYKTNTTNRAIESYESNTQSRLDEKIDMVEEWLGAIFDDVVYLCVANMDDTTVQKLIGKEKADDWIKGKPAPEDYAHYASLRIIGGSMRKPSTANKQQQALQLAQTLGQFAQAAPIAFYVSLKVLQSAFDDNTIRKEDWTIIMDFVKKALEKQGQEVQTPGGGESVPGEDRLVQVEQIINNMPPELKAELGKMIAQGVPVKDAIGQVTQIMQQMAAQ